MIALNKTLSHLEIGLHLNYFTNGRPIINYPVLIENLLEYLMISKNTNLKVFALKAGYHYNVQGHGAIVMRLKYPAEFL